MAPNLRYTPDYIVSPGSVLEEYLTELGMSKVELAERCGRPNKTISEILHGKAAITPETALQLERVLGRPASFWLSLEATYRLALAARDESASLADHVGWAKTFPVKQLIAAGHLEAPDDDSDLVAKLLGFFGVGTIAGYEARFGAMQVAYRRSPSFKAAPEAVSAWARIGEREAATLKCRPYDEAKFRKVLVQARALTARSLPEVWPELVPLAAATGVAVALVPELPKTHLSGIARWLSKDRALIQLSLRYKTADHFWFSFFHEAGHILLHPKKTIFVDEKGGDHAELEAEANKFAGDLLIPPREYASFVRRRDLSEASVRKFAEGQGIGAGIVVGRLQHEGHLAHSVCNGLKERLAWGE